MGGSKPGTRIVKPAGKAFAPERSSPPRPGRKAAPATPVKTRTDAPIRPEDVRPASYRDRLIR